ncbi:MAG: amidohydrolase [Saprospiraceae bacterium]|nr:amidohydrolase [Candidatus Defluviibacterium haderslevense]
MYRAIKIYFLLVLIFSACKVKEKADLIVYNANIYTADTINQGIEAFAIKNGYFIATGTLDQISSLKGDSTQMLDMEGRFVMPGLIEGHGHFLGLGESLINLNLLDTKSWDEIVHLVEEQVQTASPGQWIEGRGWHQDKWKGNSELTFNGYPYHDALSQISPNNPVVLYHASGHALIANNKAMELAGISAESQSPAGGRIVKDKNNKTLGVFEENAMDLLTKALEEDHNKLPLSNQQANIISKAIKASDHALKFGITSFQDAGTNLADMRILQKLCIDDILKIRLYVMLGGSTKHVLNEMDSIQELNSNKEKFSTIAVKAYMDGALGSYGAMLLKEYADNPGALGQQITSTDELTQIAQKASSKNLQMCVHAIGDKGNREVLNLYQNVLGTSAKNEDRRWRIEHAQHIDPSDAPRFHELGVIASMQAVHCTSDAPFVAKRLGDERAKNTSYIWRSLLDLNTHLANGTDAPVERINPFDCIYAAVTRRQSTTGFEFYPEQKMTRDEALKSYTIWNAYAAKEEKIKGSISVNKLADFIVLDHDFMTCKPEELLQTKVLQVYIGGKKIQVNE